MANSEQAVEIETVRICVGDHWHTINREYAEELRDTLLKVLPPKSLNNDYELKWLHAERENLLREIDLLRQEVGRLSPVGAVTRTGPESNLIDLKRKLEQEKAKQAQKAHTNPPYSLANETVAPFAPPHVTGRDGW